MGCEDWRCQEQQWSRLGRGTPNTSTVEREARAHRDRLGRSAPAGAGGTQAFTYANPATLWGAQCSRVALIRARLDVLLREGMQCFAFRTVRTRGVQCCW